MWKAEAEFVVSNSCGSSQPAVTALGSQRRRSCRVGPCFPALKHQKSEHWSKAIWKTTLGPPLTPHAYFATGWSGERQNIQIHVSKAS